MEIKKLHHKYTLFIEREDGLQWLNFKEALSKIQCNEHKEEGKRQCIVIRYNDTNEEKRVYTEAEFEEYCPEYWLFYSEPGLGFDRAEQDLIEALEYQTDLNVHLWSKGGDMYPDFFIGSIQRYATMNRRDILYVLQEQKAKINKALDSQIEYYKKVCLIGKIVETVGYMGLRVPREYEYDNALNFNFEKERAKASRLVAKTKHSLLKTYSKLCDIEEVLRSEVIYGEEEFVKASTSFIEQVKELSSVYKEMAETFRNRQAFVPAKSWNTQKDEEIAKSMREYWEEHEENNEE